MTINLTHQELILLSLAVGEKNIDKPTPDYTALHYKLLGLLDQE